MLLKSFLSTFYVHMNPFIKKVVGDKKKKDSEIYNEVFLFPFVIELLRLS